MSEEQPLKIILILHIISITLFWFSRRWRLPLGCEFNRNFLIKQRPLPCQYKNKYNTYEFSELRKLSAPCSRSNWSSWRFPELPSILYKFREQANDDWFDFVRQWWRIKDGIGPKVSSYQTTLKLLRASSVSRAICW